MRMSCNSQIHDELKNMGEGSCIFCNELLYAGDNFVDHCCDKHDILEDAYMKVCQNCGTQSYKYTSNYIDFYQNMYRIRRKSVYKRFYHIENTLNSICYENKITLAYKQRDKIYKTFEIIGSVIHLVNNNRKRMISTKFVIRQLLLGLPFEFIKVSKSKKTLQFYNRYWGKILTLKSDKIIYTNHEVNFSSCFSRYLSTIGAVSVTQLSMFFILTWMLD